MGSASSLESKGDALGAIRVLVGCWLLLPAAVIEFYARRYAYGGMAVFPDAALVALSFSALLMPHSLRARIPLTPRTLQDVEVALLCATALVLTLRDPLQSVHVFIALLILCVLLGCTCLLPFKGSSSWLFRLCVALPLATVHSLLALYYAILLIGRETWHQVVSRELLWTYTRQLPDLIDALPVAAWLPYAALAVLSVSLFAAYWMASRRICSGLTELVARLRTFVALRDRVAAARLAATALVIVAMLVCAPWIYLSLAHGAAPDPLVTTLFVKQDHPGLESMPLRADPEASARDRAVAARYAPHGPIGRKTLVLITVDGLRADQMNVYGHSRANTPFLTRLYGEGKLTRFDNAFSVCTESLCGLLAIQAGRYWHQLSTANFGLPDALKRLGYRNEFLLSGDHTNYYGLRTYYGLNVDRYRDGSMAEGYMNDDSHVLAWLHEMPAPSDPAPHFLYIHLMSVHILGKRFPQYRRWLGTAEGAGGEANCCAPRKDYINQYHDRILQADAMIAAIFADLEAKRLLHDAIVVITADHGEGLGDRGYEHHGDPPIDGEIRVPLLIYDTDRFGYPPHSLVSVADIAPTLLDRVGAPIPEHWSGRSLARPQSRRFTFAQMRDDYAVIGLFGKELFKYRYAVGARSEELINLSLDRGEQRPLPLMEYPAVFKELRAALEAEIPATRGVP